MYAGDTLRVAASLYVWDGLPDPTVAIVQYPDPIVIGTFACFTYMVDLKHTCDPMTSTYRCAPHGAAAAQGHMQQAWAYLPVGRCRGPGSQGLHVQSAARKPGRPAYAVPPQFYPHGVWGPRCCEVQE